MSEFLKIVGFVGIGIISLFLFVIFWYGAGKLFSAGFHVTKLKLIREFLISSKETDHESKS